MAKHSELHRTLSHRTSYRKLDTTLEIIIFNIVLPSTPSKWKFKEMLSKFLTLFANIITCSVLSSHNQIFCLVSHASNSFHGARLHETRSEFKPVWNLKPLWNVVPFTWQFTYRFHCGIFPNNSKALLHMCNWYLLINENLINAKRCYQW